MRNNAKSPPPPTSAAASVTLGAFVCADIVPASPGVFAAKTGKPESAAEMSKPKPGSPLQNADAPPSLRKCPAPQPTVATAPFVWMTNKCVSMAT